MATGEIRRKFEPDPALIAKIVEIRKTVVRWKREGRFIVIDTDPENLRFVLHGHRLSSENSSIDKERLEIPYGMSILSNTGNLKELKLSKKDQENLKKVGKQIVDQVMDLTRSVFGYPEKA